MRTSYYVRALIPRRLHRPLRNAVAALRAPLLRGDARHCPICDGSFRRFLESPGREDVICPRCYSAERHRLLWMYLRDQTDVFKTPTRVLHIAPENCLESRLRSMPNLAYITADLDAPADLRLDLTNASVDSESFDVILCLHVLEHIPDDAAAIRELWRMVSRAGFVVVDVPLDEREETFEPATTDAAERYRLLGQHDHVRFYGRTDLRQRLEDARFEVAVESLQGLADEARGRCAVHCGASIHVCRRAAVAAPLEPAQARL